MNRYILSTRDPVYKVWNLAAHSNDLALLESATPKDREWNIFDTNVNKAIRYSNIENKDKPLFVSA